MKAKITPTLLDEGDVLTGGSNHPLASEGFLGGTRSGRRREPHRQQGEKKKVANRLDYERGWGWHAVKSHGRSKREKKRQKLTATSIQWPRAH